MCVYIYIYIYIENEGLQIRHAIQRAWMRLCYLRNKVKPAVVAVYLRTLLNGWTTSRRMRTCSNGANSSHDICVFCENGHDSIEHFARCSVCVDLYRRHGCTSNSLINFFALDQVSFPGHFITKCKLLSVLYLIRNVLIHASHPLNIADIFRAAELTLR